MSIIISIIIVLALYVIFTYNGMISGRNKTKEAWSDIDVQLKRRYNLIPNIVETVKGFAAQEEGVFVKVTEARAKALNAQTMADHGAAENMLSSALKSMFAVAENYPQLKSNENFLQLQNELVDTEDKIQAARRFYNGNVRDYNTKLEQIPAKFVAQAFKFMPVEFFELEDAKERQNVEVSFKK
jgi:LemA protein